MKTSLREKLYNKVEGEGSFLNTKVTPKDLLKTIGVVAIATNIAGCATSGSYGKLDSNKQVTESFESYKTEADHDYFRAGTNKTSPSAILGLDKDYKLGNPESWHPLNPQDNLEKLVKNMKSKASDSFNSVGGADVLNPEEKDVDDWYSTTKRTVIKQKDATTFIIYTPDAAGGPNGGGGDSGDSGCFLGGTKILMADGTSKNISNIKEGEKVMSYSFDTNTAVPDVVAEKYSVKRNEGLYNVNGVCVTKEHPFFEKADKLTLVSGLKEGQNVIGDSDSNPTTFENIAIEDITELEMPGEFEVFNMMTGNNHNYFVSDGKGNSFLVHNKGSGGGR